MRVQRLGWLTSRRVPRPSCVCAPEILPARIGSTVTLLHAVAVTLRVPRRLLLVVHQSHKAVHRSKHRLESNATQIAPFHQQRNTGGIAPFLPVCTPSPPSVATRPPHVLERTLTRTPRRPRKNEVRRVCTPRAVAMLAIDASDAWSLGRLLRAAPPCIRAVGTRR